MVEESNYQSDAEHWDLLKQSTCWWFKVEQECGSERSLFWWEEWWCL